MKIGLIGYGAWGRHHAAAIVRTPGLELAAICAQTDASLAEATATHGVPATGNYFELFQTPGLEAVDIVLPTHLHHEAAAAALRAGLHVLLEKPMAPTAEQCESLIETAQNVGRTLLVGHEFRLSRQWGRMRALVEERAIGSVHACTIDLWRKPYRAGAGGWKRDPARVASWILEEPVHFFDLASWWMKESGAPQWVYARGNRLPSSAAGLWDNLTAVIEFESGAHATLTHSLSIAEHHLTAKLMGDRGALIATWDGEQDRTTEPIAALKLWDGERLGGIPIEASGELFELETEIAHFAAVCRGEAEPSITPDEAARAVSICLAAERSIRSGEAERI
jgi:myo-inositol 2-dehydrogenase / D-chiro-inositol 1-dehydrogenase